ncbi:hypothetical protein [Phenylobacterium sp.]|uniref:hypothetical protein n=1 Tax=Phenylobacterium sp. TaxID=1871053 RepID=UPI00301D9D0F
MPKLLRHGPLAAIAIVAAITLGGLAGCGRAADPGGTPDTSEVLARVHGEPITMNDAKAEAPSAETQEALRAVVNGIIDRRLLAKAGADGKLGQEHQVAYETARGGEIALANARGRQLAQGAAPSAEAVESYIAAHPQAFANRRFLIVDQIELRGGAGQLAGVKPARTLEELQGQLDAAKLLYQRSMGVIDTASASPATVQRILATPAGGVFEIDNGQFKIVGRVHEIRSVPFGGPFAREVASNLLKAQTLRDAVQGEVQRLRTEAGDKIEYVASYVRPDAK